MLWILRYLLLADGLTRTFLDVATVLREWLGDFAAKVLTREAPGEDVPSLVIRKGRAKRELGFAPRPVEEAIVDTVTSLRELGHVGRPPAVVASGIP